MSKVFMDTGFLDDGRLIALLSLAVVSETGAEYYAVFADGGMDAAVEVEWLRAYVIPHLPVVLDADGSGPAWDTAHGDYPQVRSRACIAADVRAFHRPPAGAGDRGLVPAVRRRGPVPALRLDERPAGRESDVRQGPDARIPAGAGTLPEQTPPVHHALPDARHSRLIAQAVGLIQ